MTRESKDILEAKGPDFRWIGIGVVYILTIQFLGGILLGILRTISIGSILLIGALACFFGGVIIGKQSPTKIVIEPALSALFAVGFATVLSIIFKINSELMSNTFIITLIILTFFSAIVGEYTGKKWQGTNPFSGGIVDSIHYPR